MSLDFLNSLVLILLISAGVLVLFAKLRLPSALGYLFAGILIGPEVFNIISAHTEIEFLSELGIILMLFMIGLEFSWKNFKDNMKALLGMGIGYITGITGTVIAGLLIFTNFSLGEAFIIGGAVAMSSTAIVSKQLLEQKEFYASHGKIAFNLVLFQDLATLVFLVAIPSLAASGNENFLGTLSLSIITMIAVFIGIYFIGKKIERPVIRLAGTIKSSEIFILTVLLIIIAAAWVSRSFNLPETIGVFLAGMVIGETEFKYKVEEDIRPFRDIFVGLFFMGMGMMLETSAFTSNIFLVMAIVFSLILLKFIVTSIIAFIAGSNTGNSLRIGLILAHCGEFSLLLILLGMKNHIISHELGQILMTSFLISTMLSTIMILYNRQIAFFILHISGLSKKIVSETIDTTEKNELSEHIIICGFGETGQNVCKLLKPSGISMMVIDTDPHKVETAIQQNCRAIYGDASNLKTLKSVNIGKCKALVVSFDDYAPTMKLLYKVRSEYPKLPIIVRTHHISHAEDLVLFGATSVLPDGIGTGISLGKEIIKQLELPDDLLQSDS